MKRLKKVKSLLFGFALTLFLGFVNTDVYAKTMTPDEIQAPAYVIGTHVFTREVNETTGYEGRLTTNLIMLASQTIGSNDLDSMIIYYKTASGMWINGLTGESIEVPKSFEIDYTNIQLEEVNNTVTAPKAPILDLSGGMLYIDKKTDMLLYQVNVYIDDIDDKSNKTDGVELNIQNGGKMTKEDLKFGDDFTTITTVLDSYEGDKLIKGKQYHSDFISIEMPANDCYYYYVSARAYVVDGNGKKAYSDFVTISVGPKNIAALEIVNNYSNPDYVAEDENYYTYNLGIKKPNDYVFKIEGEKFAYIVEMTEGNSSQIGIFGLDENFTFEVSKESVVRLKAQLGYYDINGDFRRFSSENSKEFVIDTRKKIITPVLELNRLEENYAFHRRNGDGIEVDYEMYNNAGEDSLDYNVKGIEFYQVSYYGDNMSNFQYISREPGKYYSSFVEYVKPIGGMASYVGRAYAINAVGEKVYSDYSNVVTVIRTPEIEVSDVDNGKVNVSIKNIDEYGFVYDLKYKVFNGLGDELTGLVKLNEVSSINVDSTTKLYIKIYKALDENVYSAKSNEVDVVVE